MAKTGPKPKINAKSAKEIFAILAVGASLRDAADVIGVDISTIHRHRREDPKFATGVLRAQKSGKLRLIKKVGNAKAWQAAAWLLERRWGKEFGRKIRQEITGQDGGPIQTESTIDLSGFSDDELLRFERAATGRTGGVGAPSRN